MPCALGALRMDPPPKNLNFNSPTIILFLKANVPAAFIEEVTRRTPGYYSWQQDAWQCCCGDACDFHGDLSREHLASLPEPLKEVVALTGWTQSQWTEFVQNYLPGKMSIGIYHFICRHCKQSRYGVDCD